MQAGQTIIRIVDGSFIVGRVDDGELFEAEDVAGGAEMVVRTHLDAEFAGGFALRGCHLWEVDHAFGWGGGVGIEAAPVVVVDADVDHAVIRAGADGEEGLVAAVGDLHAATELCRLLEVAVVDPGASGKGDLAGRLVVGGGDRCGLG